MRRNILRFWPILLLLLVSCIPLLWYTHANTIIMGHDTGWSLVPLDRFLDRLYPWTLTGFGYDQSLEVGTVTIYALPALLAWLAVPAIHIQKITYVFWFFTVSVSMYVCINSILELKNKRFVALGAAIFYAVNLYTLQAWTVAELSKFSIMALFPLTVALMWRSLDKKISLSLALAIFAPLALLFNGGGGSGIPLYAGALVTLVVLFFYQWFIFHKSVLQLVKVYFLFFIVFVLANLYWIFPLREVISSQYSPFAAGGGAQSVVAWTDVISANTSFLNLFRLQGFSGWYDDPTHPYGNIFLSNPFFVILSFVFPVIVFLSFFRAKDKKERKIVFFFLTLLLPAIFFTAGTHPPFGGVYAWLMTHVFGFAIFRTAFYKFGYSLWFTYAFLFSYTLITFVSKINRKLAMIGFVGVIALIAIYNFPFFTGGGFNFSENFTTKINLPPYVFPAINKLKKIPSSSRILLIPPPSPVNGQTDIYNFGYFSRTPFPFQLTQKSLITNVEINSAGQEKLTEQLYSVLARNDPRAKDFVKQLGITHILLRNDIDSNNKVYPVDSASVYRSVLDQADWISNRETLGKWVLYSVKSPLEKAEAMNPNLAYITGDPSSLLSRSALDESRVFVSSNDSAEGFPDGTDIIVTKCEACEIPGVKKLPTPSNIRIYPTSPFYLLSHLNEVKNLKNSAHNQNAYFGFLYFYADKHSIELANLAEPYIKNKNVRIDQGQRFDILKTYNDVLKKGYQAFLKLNLVQQVNVATEYRQSLEDQRERLKSVARSSFFNEISSAYAETYDQINSALDSTKLNKALSYKNTHDIFEFSAPKAGRYEISLEKPLHGIVNGKNTTLQNAVELKKGNNRIDVEKDKTPLLKIDSIHLTDSNPKQTFAITNLRPNRHYQISLDYNIQGSTGIKFIVSDNLKSQKTNTLLEQLKLPVKGYVSNFNTGGSQEVTYYIMLYAEKVTGENRNITISNLQVVDITQPTLILQNQSDTTASGKMPKVSFNYINPVHVQVHILNATDPYVLEFKDSYSPNWFASVNGEMLSHHFQINYAHNGWYIEKKGTYVVDIKYGQYTKYQVFYFISLGGVLLVILFGVFTWIRKNRL